MYKVSTSATLRVSGRSEPSPLVWGEGRLRMDGGRLTRGALGAGKCSLSRWHGPLCVLTMTLLLVLGFEKAAQAAPGDLDPDFGSGGKVTTRFTSLEDRAFDVAVQSDGKIVAVGAGYQSNFALSRYDPNGSLDTTFGGDGTVITASGSDRGAAQSVVVQPDGKIVVAGYTSLFSDGEFAVFRYNPDGSLDTSFSGDGKATTDLGAYGDQAFDVGLQSDGKIVVVGESFFSGDGYHLGLVRYDSDGSLDTSFSGDGKLTQKFGDTEEARSLVIQENGKIVVGVDTGNIGFLLVRYNPDGTPDGTYGDGGVAQTFLGHSGRDRGSLALQSDGKVVAVSNSYVGRFNSDGNRDRTFSSVAPPVYSLNAIAIQPNGKIVAVGEKRVAGSDNTMFAVYRYKHDGSFDTAFGNGGGVVTDFSPGPDVARSLAIEPTGNIVAAGYANNPDAGYSDFALARYLNPDKAVPDPVIGLTATSADGQLSLSWYNPLQDYDFEYTRVLRSSTGYATGANDTDNQTVVYEGRAESHTETGLQYDTPYYYTAFAKSSGNWSAPATTAFSDSTPPSTSIVSGPNGSTKDNTPTFLFSGSDDLIAPERLVYSYKLDEGPWSAFSDNTSVTLGGDAGLVEGQHAFYVRAKDRTGNVDGTPAVRNFAVDTAAPSTTITSGPSATVNNVSATFDFSSSEEGSTFRCALDDAATFSACTSPKEYADLGDGSHTFRVKAVDAAGNVGPIASRTWKVDTTKPVITGLRPLPDTTVVDRTPTISATVRDAGKDLAKTDISLLLDGQRITTFTYDRAKDRLAYTPGANLSYDRHTVEVSVRDSVGLRRSVVWGFKVIR